MSLTSPICRAQRCADEHFLPAALHHRAVIRSRLPAPRVAREPMHSACRAAHDSRRARAGGLFAAPPRAPSAAAQSLSPPALHAQLLQFLEEFKDKMVMRTTEVTREVDELVHEVKVCFSSSLSSRPALPPAAGLTTGRGGAAKDDLPGLLAKAKEFFPESEEEEEPPAKSEAAPKADGGRRCSVCGVWFMKEAAEPAQAVRRLRRPPLHHSRASPARDASSIREWPMVNTRCRRRRDREVLAV